MKKPLSEAYINELETNHDIHGVPRVRAEWNWNNTKYLADPAKRGSLLKVYDGTGVTVSNATNFASIFTEERFRKQIDHTSVNWDYEVNTPNVAWGDEANEEYIPIEQTYRGIEQTFYIDVKEAGLWTFYVNSDDASEFYIEGTKLTSWYAVRGIERPPTWQSSATYNFPSPGKYAATMRLYNGILAWGNYIGYRTPSMAGKPIKELEPEMTFHPDAVNGPRANPEIVGYNPDLAAVSAWKEWRNYFAVDSIVQANRPVSGIHYNEINTSNDDAYIMSPANFTYDYGQVRPDRYYMLDNEDNLQYKYWKSDQVTNSAGTLAGATVRVYYNDWVTVNKILFTANLPTKPTNMTLRYLTDVGGVETWENILTAEEPTINPITGEMNYYRNADEEWSLQPLPDEIVYSEDYSIPVKAIEFTIHSLRRGNRVSNLRAEVVEFSARKQLDVTNRTASFSGDVTMDEADWMKIIGQLSANEGQITISNWDNAFQLDESDGVKLKQTTERSTKFTVDLMYDLSEQNAEDYAVRLFTMYSADWSRQGEFDYNIRLYDSAKFLMNLPCPEIFEKDTPVHVLMAQILDSVGFGRYALDKEDYNLTAPVIDVFANEKDATVWEVLQTLSETSMCAIYFDEYDVLQLITKEQLTRAEDEDYILRGQKEGDKLPNIQSLEKAYDMEANKAVITWKTHSTKKNKDPLNPQDLTDIVWQSNDTITLRATKLVREMTYGEEDHFYIRQQDALAWPWSGKANINGEIIAFAGKEYLWVDGRTGTQYYEMIYSQEEWVQRQAKAVTGFNRDSVNRFTGKVGLKREAKTNKPIGRAADPSKFRTNHPINLRPGWVPSTLTVGNNGVWPGYWPGEQRTSFYTINDANAKSSSIGLNRPTNANDDWFKTQAIVRNGGSMSQPLQQWGFRVKFKESTTIGEISLLFNMGTSLGNSEVVTTAAGPTAFNQWYQVTFLETQGLVRNATHEIGAWVQSPDPVYRTHDNAIRGSASRMYNRNYWESWADRMKGYQFEFKRDQWYDIKVDLTRGRGYQLNASMHFFVWINGLPVAGFDAAGPPDRHKFLAPTNYWAIGSRAASKLEISNAYSWTEFSDPINELEQYRYDFTQGGYLSNYLEDGLLLPAKGKLKPYRDISIFDGEFFYDDMGSTVHEIREFDVNLDKAPVESVKSVISNESIRCLALTYSPNKAKFTVVNVSEDDVIAHGQQDLGGGQSVNHSMVLYGYVLEEGEDQTITREDRNSIKDHGEVRMDLDAKWINNKDQADDLAKWVVQHFGDPKDVIDITVFGDTSYSIGDKIKIHYDKAEIDQEWLYIISRISMRYDGESGLEVDLTCRRMRDNPLGNDYYYPPEVNIPQPEQPTPNLQNMGAISGLDTSTWLKGRVAGTDLLIPFVLENGSIGYLGGDSFSSPLPGGPDWRSPVAFRSMQDPSTGPITFDSAYKSPWDANANFTAPEIITNQHSANEFNAFGTEFTVIPNDGFSFNSTGRQIVSFMSVNRWRNAANTNLPGVPGDWRTNYTALAFTDNGNDFTRLDRTGNNAYWANTASNSSPFQMQSWQDGMDGWMYMISVKAGRQTTPMMLQRVAWDKTFNKSDYKGYNNIGGTWHWGTPDQCTSILPTKVMGEPSLRRLADGTWVMAYLVNSVPSLSGGPFAIVTRHATAPTGPWSEEKIQITQAEMPRLYGGFIHPLSTSGANGLTLLISEWTNDNYRVVQFRGSI